VTAHAIRDLAPLGARAGGSRSPGSPRFVLVLVAAAPVASGIARAPWDQLVSAGTAYLLLFPAAALVVLATWWRLGFGAATNAVAATAAAGVLVFYAGAARS
jgi:hypothetical protein